MLIDLGLISHGTEIKSIDEVDKLSESPFWDIGIDWRAKQRNDMIVWD